MLLEAGGLAWKGLLGDPTCGKGLGALLGVRELSGKQQFEEGHAALACLQCCSS